MTDPAPPDPPLPGDDTDDFVNCVVCSTNFNRGLPAAQHTLSMAALRHCDVICVAEPGNVAHRGSQYDAVMSDFHRVHAARPSSTQTHFGGVQLLVRKTSFDVCEETTLSQNGMEVASCLLLRPPPAGDAAPLPLAPVAVAIGVYATCTAHASPTPEIFVQTLAAALAHSTAGHPALPILLCGDFNAHHPAFGDASPNSPDARGVALNSFALSHHLQVVGKPTRGAAALDLVLCSSRLPVSEPEVRAVAGSDHKALIVDVDPAPYTQDMYFDRRLIVPGDIDTDRFRAVLDEHLHCDSGTPHGRDYRILNALQAAMRAIGCEWIRVPVRARRRPPDVSAILEAAHRSAWSGVHLLRRPSSRISPQVPLEELLKAFGSQGKQRDHGDAPLVRAAPREFTPVTPAEVQCAIDRHNPTACRDGDGINAHIMCLAAGSPLFLRRLAELVSECLARGILPSRWLRCDIAPIPKPGKDPSVAANLRPIYLTNMLAKTADRIIDTRIRAHFTPHPQQFGFRQGVPIDIVPLSIFGMCRNAQQRIRDISNSQRLLDTFAGSQASASQRPAAPPPPRQRQEPIRTLIIAADISDAFPGASARGIVDGYGNTLPEDLRQYKIASLAKRQIRVAHRGKKSKWDDIRDGTNQGFVSGSTDFSAFSSPLLSSLDEWSTSPGAIKQFAMVADDLSATIVGTMRELQAAGQAFFDLLAAWATRFEMKISKKTCAILVTPHGCNNAAWTGPPLKCLDVSVRPIARGSIRLLGYHFDAQLGLAPAVQHACNEHDRALHVLAPLLCALDLRDRRMIYDSLAVSHIRRIAAVLLCVHGKDNSSNWDALDSALAQGARVITGAIATADKTLVILEAGLVGARAMAIAEATRMHCKLLALNMSRSPTVRRAIDFLSRCPGANAIPAGVMGAVVDRPSAAPTDAHLASSIHIEPLPSHSPAELEVMKRHALHREPGADPENDPDEVVAAKRAANDRVQHWVRRVEANGAHIFFTDGSVVSNKRNGGGAGACAYFAAGSEQSYSRRAAGRYACSFTAEATGIACVLLMLIAHLRSGIIPPRSSCVILTDSKSYLDCLAKGPLRQSDQRIADAWRDLLAMVRDYEIVLVFRFIYGHTGWDRADRVDKEARAAAERGAIMNVEQHWWKDCAREVSKPHVNAALATAVEGTWRSRIKHRRVRQSATPGCKPSTWDKKRFGQWTRGEITILCQLRTNACTLLGGHLHGHRYECPRCRTPTMRGAADPATVKSMVEHAFICPRAHYKRRTFRIKGIADLWARPRRAFDYVNETFLAHRIGSLPLNNSPP
jgi:ribonuclease HI